MCSGYTFTVQYENYLIRQKQQFPGLDPEAAKYAFDSLPTKGKPTSPVDSWLGSLTSKEYYPQYTRGTSVNKSGQNITTGQYDFGTNFEDYFKSLSDQKLADKYRIRQQSPPVASK